MGGAVLGHVQGRQLRQLECFLGLGPFLLVEALPAALQLLKFLHSRHLSLSTAHVMLLDLLLPDFVQVGNDSRTLPILKLIWMRHLVLVEAPSVVVYCACCAPGSS